MKSLVKANIDPGAGNPVRPPCGRRASFRRAQPPEPSVPSVSKRISSGRRPLRSSWTPPSTTSADEVAIATRLARRARSTTQARLAERAAPGARAARALSARRRGSPARGRCHRPRRHERARRAPRDARGAHDRRPRGRGACGHAAARGGAAVPGVRGKTQRARVRQTHREVGRRRAGPGPDEGHRLTALVGIVARYPGRWAVA